jgi:hypothetical protein
MNQPLATSLAAAALGALIALTAFDRASAWQQQLPDGHPPVQPQLPPGHPPMPSELPPGHPPMNPQLPAGHPSIGDPSTVAVPPARPADVAGIDALVSAYYESVSGAAGEARDWDRFRSLFIPEARMIVAQSSGPGMPCAVLTPEQFIQMNSTYFERGGYHERDIHRRTERFGNVAHVFSTYESRRRISDAVPYSRGVNSMQLVNDGERWWIATVLWDFERPDNQLEAEHLPETPPAPPES